MHQAIPNIFRSLQMHQGGADIRLIALKHKGHNLIIILFSVSEIIKLMLLFLKVMKEAPPMKLDLNNSGQ